MFPKKTNVEPGMIVRHDPEGGLTYRVDKVVGNTDDYEFTHVLNGLRRVVYTQLEERGYPAGTEWDKDEAQFRANFTPIEEVDTEQSELQTPKLEITPFLFEQNKHLVTAEETDVITVGDILLNTDVPLSLDELAEQSGMSFVQMCVAVAGLREKIRAYGSVQIESDYDYDKNTWVFKIALVDTKVEPAK